MTKVVLGLGLVVLETSCGGDDKEGSGITSGTEASETGDTTTDPSTGEPTETTSASTGSTSSATDSATGTTTTGDSTSSTTTGTDGSTGGGTDTEGAGGASCPLVLNCLSACMDEPCQQACFAMGSSEGQTEAVALIECDATNMCGGDQMCLDANCTMELGDCLTGTMSCAELLGCTDSCMGDDVCNANCYYEGTPEAQQLFGAILQCAQDHMCQDGMCVQDNCGDEIMACFA